MRPIYYEQLIKNYKDMINTLEYDSMRSGGKAKLNSTDLTNMHNLVERYQKELNNSSKQSPKKEVANG